MQIVKTSVYVGPNIYSKEPLIRLTLDLHRRADVPVLEGQPDAGVEEESKDEGES